MPARARITNVDDARRLARRSLPPAMFDYIDGGAEDEITMNANIDAFRSLAFRPRAGVDVGTPSIETSVLGTPTALPLLLAPCGLIQGVHPEGALGASRAAQAAGTIFALSTYGGAPPEVLADEPGPRWFQLYAADRTMAADLIERAATSGYGALVVTLDSPTTGKRDKDARHGTASPMDIKVTPRNALRFGPQMATRPQWALRMARTTLAAVKDSPVPGSSGTSNRSSDATAPTPVGRGRRKSGGFRTPTRVSPFTWDDIRWIRERWSGPLILKAILSGADARTAVDLGADAVAVSNHGGRQLEGAPSTLSVLPEVVDAVGSDVEVLVDGGMRRGGDVLKAIALGARAALIGRPYLYGLAASGQQGVKRVIDLYATDMLRTLVLLGCPSVTELDRSWLRDARPNILGC